MKKPLKTYLISLGAVLLASVYPIYMGGIMLTAYLRDGGVNVTDYPKYIIPYTPISIALIICVALLPLAFKYCKKYTLPMLSVLAVLLFLGSEMAFEKVTVFSGTADENQIIISSESEYDDDNSGFYWFKVTLENDSGVTETRIMQINKAEADQKTEDVLMWQAVSCMYRTPDEWLKIAEIQMVTEKITDGTVIDVQKIYEEWSAAEQSMEERLTERSIFKNPYITKYSPVFKVHFYIISVVIDLAVLGVIYGFYKMAQDAEYKKKKPLVVQLISVTVFVGLCILACFTAFYRTGEIVVSPVSAVLMAVFFIVFGVTAGVFAGTWTYGKRKLFSLAIPALIAAVTTVVMYIGEMVMMQWNLYRFGEGALFSPIGVCPLAPVDFAVITASGVITYFALFLISSKKPKLETEI